MVIHVYLPKQRMLIIIAKVYIYFIFKLKYEKGFKKQYRVIQAILSFETKLSFKNTKLLAVYTTVLH